MVKVRDLPNKPLVEAILEMRWHIDPDKGDPNYSLFVGRLYSSLSSKYQFHQPLPTSMIPEQMAVSIAQHRFRVDKDKWPLVQIGPGLITLNDTVNYTWDDFNIRANELIRAVFKVYTKPQELKVTNLILRYIDAINIDDFPVNMLDYARRKLKINLQVPANLYDGVDVIKRPRSFNFGVTHVTRKPKGLVTLKFTSGVNKGKRAIFLETVVKSADKDLPILPGGFGKWIKAAHNITDDWFFKLIEGELESEYAGE